MATVPSSPARSAFPLTPTRAVEVLTETPPLRTPRLELRPLTSKDEDRYLLSAKLSKRELSQFLPLHMEGESDAQMFRRQLDLAKPTAGRDWMRFVAISDDGRLVGGVNLNAITRGLEWRADINWWVATDVCGRGYGTEAVGAVLNHALGNLPGGLGLLEVHAWITRDNPASIRIAEKLGMVKAADERSYLLTDSRNWVLHDLWIRRAEMTIPG